MFTEFGTHSNDVVDDRKHVQLHARLTILRSREKFAHDVVVVLRQRRLGRDADEGAEHFRSRATNFPALVVVIVVFIVVTIPILILVFVSIHVFRFVVVKIWIVRDVLERARKACGCALIALHVRWTRRNDVIDRLKRTLYVHDHLLVVLVGGRFANAK